MLDILEITGRTSAICRCVVCKQPFEVRDRFMCKKAHAGDQCISCKNLPSNPPTQALLHQIYNYDPMTGKLSYKRDFSRRKAGDDPTSLANTGYPVLTMDKTYLAHRIVWLMQTGTFPKMIDHINHIRHDLRWENLRDASSGENYSNKSVNRNNTSGYLGVSYMPIKQKYRATITINRKQHHLGLFDTAEQAHQARLAANQLHGFHDNHGI